MQQQMDVQKLGTFIQSLRKEKALTQRQLGELLGVTDKAVSKWERGLSFPDITLLPGLAKHLDASVGELIAGERITENVSAESFEKVVNQTMEYSQKSFKDKSQKNALFILLAVITLISIVCLVINIAVNKAINWSLYPIGAMAVVFLPCIPILLCKEKKTEYTTLALFLSVCGFDRVQ